MGNWSKVRWYIEGQDHFDIAVLGNHHCPDTEELAVAHTEQDSFVC